MESVVQIASTVSPEARYQILTLVHQYDRTILHCGPDDGWSDDILTDKDWKSDMRKASREVDEKLRDSTHSSSR